MGDFSCIPLRDLDDGQRDFVRSLFEEAFPPWQREPFGELMAREEAGHAATVVLADGRQALALAVTSCLTSIGWSYLEYFAVAGGYRDRGIGGHLWRAMGQDLVAREQPGRVVLDVEDPGGAADGSPERLIRERRIRFYLRQGARLLPVRDYLVPRLDGVEGTEPMLLMWAAIAGDAEPPAPPELSSLLPAVYAAGYEVQADDALVLAALRASGAG
jgi:ribosomal protein S18 acetylase RimI-like enzyme